MDMTKEKLDQELRVVGDRVSDPPSDVNELISLLNEIEKLLSQVEQSPKGPLNVSTSLVLKALADDKILRSTDADVRVSVAACLSQIIRITAPDAPYNDKEMKELLQLIVSTFEKLDDKSSLSYDKRITILENMARIRLSVLMLDLECDSLIIEMLNHFFLTLRDYHPEVVLSSMSSIITLVLEESEDISPQMLSPILACLRQDNKGALPIAQRLAEDVLSSCASKVKPFLLKAIDSLGVSLDDYNHVVTSLCRDECVDMEFNQVPAEEKVSETTQADADALNDKSPKSEISNDVTQAGKDEILVDSGSTESKEGNDQTDLPNDADGNAETNRLGIELTELDKASLPPADKPDEVLPVGEDRGKDLLGSTKENPSAELAVACENGKETNNEEEEEAASQVKDAKQSADDNSETPEPETQSATLGDVGEDEENLLTNSEPMPKKRFRKRVVRYSDSGSLRRRKKSSRGRVSRGRDFPKTSAQNDETGMVTSPKANAEVVEDKYDSEATPKASPKRKRTPAKGKAATSPGRHKGDEQYGEDLIGARIRVWWPMDRKFYEGVVDSYNSSRRKHRVLYDDGEEEQLFMRKETWEFIEDNAATADEKEASNETSRDATPEPAEKKAKTDVKSAKRGTVNPSTKSKSGKKSKDAEEEGAAEEGESSKAGNSKYKEKGGTVVAAASSVTGKPEDDEKETPKSSKTAKKPAQKKEKKESSGPSSSKAAEKKSKKNSNDHAKRDDDDDDDDKPLASLLKKKSPAAKAKPKTKAKGAKGGSSGTKRKR